jgi:hypothetical protein
MAKRARRTTHRSSTGTKLYVVRNRRGVIQDIQTYRRAHRADLAHKSKAELERQTRPRPRKDSQ